MTPEENAAFEEKWDRIRSARKKFRDRVQYLMTPEGVEETVRIINDLSLGQCTICSSVRSYEGMSHVAGGTEPSPILGHEISIPTIVIRCTKCGLITQHCAATLGLIERQTPLPDPMSMFADALGKKDK